MCNFREQDDISSKARRRVILGVWRGGATPLGYQDCCINPNVAKNDVLKRARVRQPWLRGGFCGLRRTYRSLYPEKLSTGADGVPWCERQRFQSLAFCNIRVYSYRANNRVTRQVTSQKLLGVIFSGGTSSEAPPRRGGWGEVVSS